MQTLYPTYTLRVEVKDIPPAQQNSSSSVQGLVGAITIGGNPSGQKWFNPSADKIGCDDVLKEVRAALQKAGIAATITFDKFEHR